jgi:hypothetical protein
MAERPVPDSCGEDIGETLQNEGKQQPKRLSLPQKGREMFKLGEPRRHQHDGGKDEQARHP